MRISLKSLPMPALRPRRSRRLKGLEPEFHAAGLLSPAAAPKRNPARHNAIITRPTAAKTPKGRGISAVQPHGSKTQLVGPSTSRSIRLSTLRQRSTLASKLAHTDTTRSNPSQRNPRRGAAYSGNAAIPKNINSSNPSSRDAVTSTDTPADTQPLLSSNDSDSLHGPHSRMANNVLQVRSFGRDISPPILFVRALPGDRTTRLQVNMPPPVADLMNNLGMSGGAERVREIESECRHPVLFRHLRKVSANSYTSNNYFLWPGVLTRVTEVLQGT